MSTLLDRVRAHRTLRYVFAVAATLPMVAVTDAIHPYVQPVPVPLFLLTVLFVAWTVGFGPAVAALAVSAITVDYFITPPVYSLAPSWHDALWLPVFLAVGLIVASLAATRRRFEGERARLMEAEHAARAAAESANRAKDEFLAIFGHELRNPLTAISTAVRILEQIGTQDAPAVHARQVIGRQAAHLARMMDDLVDVNRIIAGRVVLDRRPLDLDDAVRRAVATLGAGGRLQGYAVKLDAHPVWIEADAVRLEQVLINLLDNAVKYTPAGGLIGVVLKAHGHDAVLQIRDSGIGIEPDLLPRVFDLFVQGDPGSKRRRGGLGIGLAVVRRLVELHGGSVRVESDGPGRGSTFSVRLPRIAAPAGHAPASRRDVPATSPRRVLIVEDDPDARDMLRVLLELGGHEVWDAEDGKRGLDAVDRVRPDTVLIDIGLPDVDGYEVARRIRASPHGHEVVLLAVTGYAKEQDRERSQAAGFDHYLVKPIDPDLLARALAA